MANVRRLGFLPTRVSGGTPITLRKTRVLTNNTLAIGFGDGVKFAATGDIVACAAGTDESILLASVAQGVTYVRSTDSTRIEAKALPASTTYTSSAVWPDNASFCYVVDNATMVEFEANLTNGPAALTDLNQNVSMVLTTINTTTGFSKHELNFTGHATTSTLPWRIREFVLRADNDLSLTDQKVLCMINAGQAEPVTSAYTGT